MSRAIAIQLVKSKASQVDSVEADVKWSSDAPFILFSMDLEPRYLKIIKLLHISSETGCFKNRLMIRGCCTTLKLERFKLVYLCINKSWKKDIIFNL